MKTYNNKKISSSALIALKEALAVIYWTKKDLKNFIDYTIENKGILSTINWQDNVKYESVSQLIDRMNRRPDIFFNDLLNLFKEVVNFTNFNHLKRWDDAETKIEIAKQKVEILRNHAKGYFSQLEEKEEIKKRIENAKLKREQSLFFQDKLEKLKSNFYEIASSTNHQQRGFNLEIFLNELFILFDLDPKSSFKIIGEQIDGAFTFDNNDYLLEAKWQKSPVNAGDLFKFAGKLSGKLKNTLGLFISIDGFSDESLQVDAPIIKSMILMTGADIVSVLENRIDLRELLYRKRRHASETGCILFTVEKIL